MQVRSFGIPLMSWSPGESMLSIYKGEFRLFPLTPNLGQFWFSSEVSRETGLRVVCWAVCFGVIVWLRYWWFMWLCVSKARSSMSIFPLASWLCFCGGSGCLGIKQGRYGLGEVIFRCSRRREDITLIISLKRLLDHERPVVRNKLYALLHPRTFLLMFCAISNLLVSILVGLCDWFISNQGCRLLAFCLSMQGDLGVDWRQYANY